MLSGARAAAAEVGALIFQRGMVLLYVALAAAVEVHGDPVLRARGLPLIAATFFLGWATTAFHRHAAGLRFYPRRLRLRLELEQALFLANQAVHGRGDRQSLADQLRSTRRRASRTVLGERIAGLAGILASGEPEAVKTVADELASIVRELASHNGRRYPLRWIGMLPGECILPASTAIGLIGAAIGPLSPAAPLLSISGLLEALLFAGIANAGLRLIQTISHKVHDIRSKAGFRTILVTDRRTLTEMGATAAALVYSKIGHLVMIFGEDELDALTAYADHADLIVLDTAVQALAAEVRALTKLPPARYLALSIDGTTPPGYRWVDPRALLILPSDWRARQPDGDPYRWGVRRSRRPWEDAQFLIYLFAAVLFGFVERGVPLALFLGVAAICQILPDRLGPRRRASISRSTLRVPHSPGASRRLVPRKLERRLWIATGLLGLAACAYLVPPLQFDWSGKMDPSVLELVGAAWLALFAGRSIVYAGLILRKWWVDWQFRILVLRRNSRTFGYGHKAFVMATCGKYGQVVSLQDYSLDRTDDDYGEWRESSLGSWFRIFSEIGNTLKPDAFLHGWQRQVRIELETVDFAVFDWIEEVTDNMRWELGAALDRLPACRLLIICSPDNEPDLTVFLDSRIAPGAARPRSLRVSRGPDDRYIWSRHDDFDQAFSLFLHQALTALVVEPREVQKWEGAGAWAYPRISDEAASSAVDQSARTIKIHQP
jgi:hypothetical protein